MTDKKPPFIVILGPTASGKSALGVDTAEKHDGYIISADSRQIYRDMDIGTGKCTKEEMRGIPHFMVDIVDPDTSYTVAEFQRCVFDILKTEQGFPLIVGGTGQYISAIVENWDIPTGKPNDTLRKELEMLSLDDLTNRLNEIDPASAATIDLKNKRRVIRALEVVESTGVSFVHQQKQQPLPYRVLQIGLSVEKDILAKKIDNRVNKMIKDGLVDEVKSLIDKYGSNAPGLNAIGYFEIIESLNGKTSLDEATDLIKLHSRQYAKRQMTWFKRDGTIHWIDNADDAMPIVSSFLK